MGVLVGRKAPQFKAAAVINGEEVVEDFSLDQYIGKKHVILFFYPKDFTFVCPSELIAFSKRIPHFEKRNTQVIGISIDSHFTHNAWRNTPANNGGIGDVNYPLIADLTHAICKDYDVETPDGAVAYRGSFLIDTKGIVRHQVVNDLPLGRDVDEMIRMVDSLLFHEEHGEVCPAGWNKGDAGMKATPEGVAAYLSENEANL